MEMNTEENTNANSLEARKAKAEARKRAAEEKRRAAEAEHEKIREIEVLEMEADDEEAIEKAEAEHGIGKVAVIRTSMGCVIVKRPRPMVYKRFRDKAEAKTRDLELLVRDALVYPDSARFDLILTEQQGTLDRAANKVVELAGFRAKEAAGKS